MSSKIMANKTSVLLVDDHSLVRRGFRRMVEDEADLEVIGEASDGEEAIRLAQALRPEVIVMDCALPGINGLVATRRILEILPKTAILMLSMHPEDQYAVRGARVAPDFQCPGRFTERPG